MTLQNQIQILLEETRKDAGYFYHTTRSSDFQHSLVNGTINVGEATGLLYGPGIYTFFNDPDGEIRNHKNKYGPNTIKFYTNIKNFFISEWSVFKETSNMKPGITENNFLDWQLKKYGIEIPEAQKKKWDDETQAGKSLMLHRLSNEYKKPVNGMIYFNGRQDGDVAVIWNIKAAIPISYKDDKGIEHKGKEMFKNASGRNGEVTLSKYKEYAKNAVAEGKKVGFGVTEEEQKQVQEAVLKKLEAMNLNPKEVIRNGNKSKIYSLNARALNEIREKFGDQLYKQIYEKVVNPVKKRKQIFYNKEELNSWMDETNEILQKGYILYVTDSVPIYAFLVEKGKGVHSIFERGIPNPDIPNPDIWYEKSSSVKNQKSVNDAYNTIRRKSKQFEEKKDAITAYTLFDISVNVNFKGEPLYFVNLNEIAITQPGSKNIFINGQKYSLLELKDINRKLFDQIIKNERVGSLIKKERGFIIKGKNSTAAKTFKKVFLEEFKYFKY
jgi:hypothetical protein